MKRVRRCDSRCHNAKGKRCTCICGGRYHGINAKKADKLLFDDLEELKKNPVNSPPELSPGF